MRYASLKSLLPGVAIFVVGVLIWLSTAGLLLALALPVIALGTFLLFFAAVTTQYDSPRVQYTAIGIACGAAAFGAALVWPIV
jgi:hypothetical protein